MAATKARFQSTHPRGVRRAPGWDMSHRKRCVSIHAPAWGATMTVGSIYAANSTVSIHAPAWGATRRTAATCDWDRPFQSTHPRGVRLSILSAWPRPRRGFNPRTRVGCDPPNTGVILRKIFLFQSTHPRGVRPDGLHKSRLILAFQSTHPRGVRRRG